MRLTDASENGTDEEDNLLPTRDFNIDEELDIEENVPHPRQAAIGASLSRLRKRFGRRTPQIQKINPVFPEVQGLPDEIIERYFPEQWQKLLLLFGVLALWGLSFILTIRKSTHALNDGVGQNVLNLDCVDTLWNRKNKCGLNGMECAPFANTSFAFRCPASCTEVQVLEPHAVGPLDVTYRPLVVGDGTYRGDSFLCGSAIHAGVVSNLVGGCGRVELVGRHEIFPSSQSNGIESIPFDSYFPLSFSISSDPEIRCEKDPRQNLLLASMAFTMVFSLFVQSPALRFFVTFTVLFMHVAFVSDPPSAPHYNTSKLPHLIAKFAERFLPAGFCAAVIYQTCIAKTLLDLKAPFETTFLWLGAFWFGALSNITFDWIPIQRLTSHDIEQQPGAKLALAIILIILVAIVLQQIRMFWLEQRLLRYLALYGLFILGILLCLAIPGVQLRLHHYIIGLLLLPGTSVQTRPSLLYQGLLLGLFVNGVARWGFDSVLQTPEMLRGDGTFGSAIPAIKEPSIRSLAGVSTINFFVAALSSTLPNFEGISVLVNDVERHRQFFSESDSMLNFTWNRPQGKDLPEYFRFSFLKNREALDYSSAGTWFANGSWYMASLSD